AELDFERAGHRGFGPAGVRRCVARRGSPPHAQSASACKNDQASGDACGNEIRNVIGACSRPAERAPAWLAMTDETVGRVQRLLTDQAPPRGHRETERW